MRKLPIWLIALALTAMGAAVTIGYGYQKANDDGINGTVNIITSQSIGVEQITFGNWEHTDDSAIGVVAEDGLSYVIGMQLNNGDEYGGKDQEIYIQFKNYAKTDMIVKLTTEFSITQPDQADAACDDIHIWYTRYCVDKGNVGQIDPWTYMIEIPAMDNGSTPGTITIMMWVDVGNTIVPGFYTFQTFIEPSNWDDVQVVKVKDPPPTTIKEYGIPFYTDGEDNWITTSTLIYLNATDGPGCKSGVKETWYKIDDGEWTQYIEPFTIPDECSHTIYYYSIDNLGNTETEKNQDVNVDDTPPTTIKEYGTPFYSNEEDNWINTSTLIYLNATDGPECYCGVKETWYKIDDGEWTQYVEPFTIPDECSHTIYYYSIDYLGNTETTRDQVVNVDDTPPTTIKEYGTPFYSDEEDNWITTSTLIYLNATDDPACKSKVKEIWYRINDGEWTQYIEPFTIPEECSHTIYYYSIDYIGNTETTKNQIVNVDDTPPTTIKEYGTPFYTVEGENWITELTLIYLNATDGPECYCGVKEIWYRIDEGEWTQYVEPFTIPIPDEGPHTIYYYSIDYINNIETEKNQIVYIEGYD